MNGAIPTPARNTASFRLKPIVQLLRREPEVSLGTIRIPGGGIARRVTARRGTGTHRNVV
jgi:hypothetical protein